MIKENMEMAEENRRSQDLVLHNRNVVIWISTLISKIKHSINDFICDYKR
jgi:hypothetical protein